MANKMNTVVWFEIPVKDLDRAKAFYAHVLDVKFTDNEMGPMKMAFFPMTEGLSGATGALIKAAGRSPSKNGVVLYFYVKDIPAALDKIKAKGGKVLTTKTAIGEWGFMTTFTDSEGNTLALHSPE